MVFVVGVQEQSRKRTRVWTPNEHNAENISWQSDLVRDYHRNPTARHYTSSLTVSSTSRRSKQRPAYSIFAFPFVSVELDPIVIIFFLVRKEVTDALVLLFDLDGACPWSYRNQEAAVSISRPKYCRHRNTFWTHINSDNVISDWEIDEAFLFSDLPASRHLVDNVFSGPCPWLLVSVIQLIAAAQRTRSASLAEISLIQRTFSRYIPWWALYSPASRTFCKRMHVDQFKLDLIGARNSYS